MQYSKSGSTKYMSFKGCKDYDRKPKVGFESLASPGQVITVSTAQGFNTSRNAYSSSVLQTDAGIKQVGTGYMVTTYIPKIFDTSSPGHAHYNRASPISNITSQNVSVPAKTAFVGTTDLRSASSPSGPAQLTIFYAGSVCVYNDVSPEKAQAIMLLAGNGNSPKNPSNKTPPSPTLTAPIAIQETRTQTPLSSANNFISKNNLSDNRTTPLCLSEIPSPTPISVCIPRHASCGVTNGFLKNSQSSSTNFPSPISVCSRSSAGQSADVSAARSFSSLASPNRKPEHCQVSVPQGTRVSTTTTTTPSVAVPQARKASLARFLEKRKERAVTVAPYPCPEKQSPECLTLQSETKSFSITSASSFPLSSIAQK